MLGGSGGPRLPAAHPPPPACRRPQSLASWRMSERRIVDRPGTVLAEPARAPGRPHLAPACCALLAAAALLAGVRAYVAPRLPARLPFYAAHAMSFKVNGNVLQSVAFRAPGELPIYGSSELDLEIDNRPDEFFQHRPAGFAAFPVGRGGGSSLIILQKLAAVGGAARGKRVVVMLSSTWFLQPGVGHKEIGANLAGSQLSAWLFGDSLPGALKADIARRMEDYSDELKDQTLNVDALRCLAHPTLGHRLRFALLFPLGRLQNALLEQLDYGVLLWEMAFPQRRFNEEDRGRGIAPAVGEAIDWDALAAQAQAGMGNAPIPGDQAVLVRSERSDRKFLSQLGATREFDDLLLLVRVLRELKMEACFISQPFNGVYGGLSGVSPQARSAYYQRLEAVLRPSGYALHDFSGSEEDRYFFSDDDHPSAKGWILYDHEIARFWQGGETTRPR